ncbi:glycogen debranching protein GlgX [Marinomonas mediterranea]|jgi:glycogen debranching enzyme GlgX|uniref:Glycogen debranching enzyme GlgX n=1 Tax=Marinomonas mediterranea (strain ATCC 700492 / JCM 21426 / NBRC 103028 / MMB-1) TaxID=717774 RepID=F2K2V8_MARM1|nr:glycogen debranching protein GlgX [Marinomonas mediterranea]ADZ92347.1 glycogen debranching enzyme GlgX [Marinomonas mediterranea MMB-1]WCN18397.1 glycogen debranching protein GlgX [Marinomonas mediterranea MMB-1]
MPLAPLVRSGSPLPLGANVTDEGVNFAVASEDATQIYLCLFNENDEEEHVIPFVSHHRGIWHMEVLGLKEGQHYGFRAEGTFSPKDQLMFNRHKLLIDPYAKSLTGTLEWHPDLSAMYSDGHFNPIDTAHYVPKSIVKTITRPDDAPARVSVKGAERSLYELHIKGFSKNLEVSPELKGTYLGVVSEQGISHLKELGVTTIQLMPCFAFANERHLQKLGLQNYWGYNPINFFTPDHRYAVEDPVIECQTMIMSLKRAGFEVIIDVVYNHTAESELDQASFSFKGLDNARYYRHENGEYLNYTGCGNCVNTYHPAAVRLICDSMRYWVDVMGVDGFRFDLGVDLGREKHDFSSTSPLLQAILQDPVLSETCLVMEPWDIGPNGYQVGNFPRGFLECNDKYRDIVRRFWRGDEGIVGEFATRFMGSRDVFHKGYKCALHSVNYISYHDGYTLHDLVSYHRRHNHANMENNRDGHGDNISQNFGVEGPTSDNRIKAQRLNQQLCFLATLLLSQGTPHILGGDELSHTQHGNNNAYCQDNQTTWLGWQNSDEREQLQSAIKTLLNLRKAYPVLAEVFLEDDPLYQYKESDKVEWVNEAGRPMSNEDWSESERDFLSVLFTTSDLSSRLWLIFYREDQVLDVPLIKNARQHQLLFYTPGVAMRDNHLHITERSVALVKLLP